MNFKKRKSKQKDLLVMTSLGLLFVSLLLLCGFLAYKIYTRTEKVGDSETTARAGLSPTMAPWEVYENFEFNFRLEVPRLLLKEEAHDKANYTYIVIFGENRYSNSRGVAIGVTDRPLEEEIELVKGQYEKSGEAELNTESVIEVAGEKGTRLSFKPKGESDELEAKDVVVFRHGNYTYTLSTVPEQVEHIVGSFKFL
jgi:hypothetical protein